MAYLFYTSGSTGRPKGVVQNHRNVLHQIMTYTNGLQLARDDCVTQLHSHGFSASRLDIFGALLNGAALFPISVAEEGFGRFARLLRDEGITILHWVPTAFRHFANTLDKGDLFPRLRLLVLGSEPLSSRDVYLYKQHFSPGCVLVNRFGTTETGNIRWYFNGDTVFASTAMERGFMTKEEFDLYVHVFRNISRDIMPPDIFVYLNVSSDECYRRMNRRSRTEEEGVPLDYLQHLDNNYRKLVKMK